MQTKQSTCSMHISDTNVCSCFVTIGMLCFPHPRWMFSGSLQAWLLWQDLQPSLSPAVCPEPQHRWVSIPFLCTVKSTYKEPGCNEFSIIMHRFSFPNLYLSLVHVKIWMKHSQLTLYYSFWDILIFRSQCIRINTNIVVLQLPHWKIVRLRMLSKSKIPSNTLIFNQPNSLLDVGFQ